MLKKHKILMISDHQLATSGVAVQSRFLIDGLISTGRYTFRCLGAAIKHEKYDIVAPHPDFIIKPIDGFGDPNTIRQLLVAEKPDMLLLFTDPRFFDHVWQMEEEIHQICPIGYNTIWDDATFDPDYNRYVYDSCDLLHCINWGTYEFVSQYRPGITYYTPHAVPANLYHPLPKPVVEHFKRRLLGQDRVDHFTVLYVGRNAHRKRTSDVMWAFKMFLDRLEAKHGHRKANIVVHANPLDQEGTNLIAVAEKLQIQNNVVFSQSQVAFEEMVLLYNACDVLVNASRAEGFGLPVLEAKMCGKPVIAAKTGGLTRQVEDHVTGEQYGVALPIVVKNIMGHLVLPYICDEYCTVESIADAYEKMFEMPQAERDALGQRAMEHAQRFYDMNELIKSWDVTIQDTIQNWRSRREAWKHIEL